MTLSVAETLPLMQSAVKRGNLLEAATHGEHCILNLSISPTVVTFGEVLSEGAESRVFLGNYQGKSIAIKKPFIRTTADLERFREELNINSLLQHDHIVEVIGARVLPPHYFLMMDLEGVSYYHSLHLEGYQPQWCEILRVGVELSDAIRHIHDLGIIHRDLKTRNILQGRDGKTKLIDFGIAIRENQEIKIENSKPTGGFHKSSILGTLEYMAPEVLLKNGHSFPSDVYAFGICLNELATAVYPFSDCNKDNPDAHTVLEMGYGRQELAAAVAADGLRPTLPKNCPRIFSELLTSCWALDPAARPSMDQVHAQFKAMYSQLANLDFPKIIGLAPRVQRVTQDESVEEVKGDWKVEVKTEGYSPCVNPGFFATAGFRGEDRMEDRHLIETQFCNSGNSLFAVFDGHRGTETSEFCKLHFSRILDQQLRNKASISDALDSAFLEIERRFELTDSARISDPRGLRYPGCTALLTLLIQDQLFIANAGDCRAMLCRDGEPLELSRDHNANDVMERLRVQKTNVKIEWKRGSWRIGEAGIQVTRSLGDVDLKPKTVIANPEITSFTLSPADEFLVLATDGLWDVLSNQEVLRLVQDTVKHPDLCAKRLAMEALTRGSQDNITVLVVFLRPVSTLEQIFVDGTSKYQVTLPKKGPTKVVPAADEITETL